MIALSNHGIILRDFREGDQREYEALRNDFKFQRFYREEEAAEQRAASLLAMFIAESNAVPRLKYRFAVVSGSGELMGACGICVQSPRLASIGCELGRQWQWTGVARHVCVALLDFGFTELGVFRVYAETISDNVAAKRLCRTLGMSLYMERVDDLFFKDRAWNTTIFQIWRDDWLRRRGLSSEVRVLGQ
ncbi:GNAT family N-acetyltransferase [Paraburkholderia youngii]|uniref:GNAT family N-acetyltransferase n=1 Tax=Paraburkholderia youngii TaxID=2782701 RepID=UPI003D1DA6DB